MNLPTPDGEGSQRKVVGFLEKRDKNTGRGEMMLGSHHTYPSWSLVSG